MAKPSMSIKLNSSVNIFASIKQEPPSSPPSLPVPQPIQQSEPLQPQPLVIFSTIKQEPPSSSLPTPEPIQQSEPPQPEALNIFSTIKQEPPSSPPSLPAPQPMQQSEQHIQPSEQQQLQPLNIFSTNKLEPPSSPLSLPAPEPIQPTEQPIQQSDLQQPKSQQPPSQQEQQQREPQFLKSINDLASVSSAIHVFKCRFDELTKHLDFINEAIDSKFNQPQQHQHPQEKTVPDITVPKAYPQEQTVPETTVSKAYPQENTVPKTTLPKTPSSYIQSLCKRMCSKELHKYIVTHLSNVSKLREEVPVALKLAPKPAKLVLDCIWKFFLQEINAYTKNSPMIPARQASVLVLEFFLLMMGDFRGEGQFKIAADIKVEAEEKAVAWRKRLISEGGLDNASEVDARGLLLFVACFGIPKVFRSEDLGNLLRLCNLRAISDALKGSPVLPDKMPAIIEAMAKNGTYVEAVDVASIFGLEDKFSPKTILTLFLQESTKAFKRAKQEAQISPVALRKANEKQLDALKSIVQYLEDRRSDITKLLGAWQIEDKIVKLEEEIAEINKRIEDKKMIPKRKLDEMGSSSRVKSPEMKCSRFATEGAPLPKSSRVNGLHEQRTAILAEGVRSYDGLMPNSYNSAISGHFTNYPAASAVPQGSTIGPLSENGVGQMVGSTGVGSSGMVTNIGVISTSSYSGAHGGIEVDKAAQMMSSSGLPYAWQQGSVRQSASMRFSDFFGSSPSVEGFVGLPDTTDRTPTDLYGFVDSID